MNPADPAAIRARILAIAAQQHPGPLDASGDLSEQLDSVQRLTLVVALEDEFRICFEPEDEQEIRTLEQVVALVTAKVADAS